MVGHPATSTPHERGGPAVTEPSWHREIACFDLRVLNSFCLLEGGLQLAELLRSGVCLDVLILV